MKTKIDRVLLIDDDDPTNFLHRVILEDSDCVNNIEVAESAKEALSILLKVNSDLIFLDLNMPAMTGWDFIRKFNELDFSTSKKPIIYILTTSENPDDRKRAKSISDVSGFITKPLSVSIINEIVKNHFMI